MQSRDKKWDSFPPLEELRKEYASDCPRIDLQYGLNHEILMVPKFADEIKTLKDLYDYISVFYKQMLPEIDWKKELLTQNLSSETMPYLRIRKSGFVYLIPLVQMPTTLKELHDLISAVHEYVGWRPWPKLRLSFNPDNKVITEISDLQVEEAIKFALEHDEPFEAWWHVRV
eukprot:Phypoly_transcript_20401.p1 GENE.Phypoly_transcript_20401~~Phypoly_transcript_20401.p1  ORF type:complete len:172 (+),score=14.67 Phypoly_transcript_20401:154-669(+)